VWGHASDGWWALITWRENLTDPETHVGIVPHLFAAWAAAGYLEPERNADRRIYAEVRRIALPDDRSAWPRPPDWDHDDPHYLGILDGTEPAIPPQLGGAWRGKQGSAYDSAGDQSTPACPALGAGGDELSASTWAAANSVKALRTSLPFSAVPSEGLPMTPLVVYPLMPRLSRWRRSSASWSAAS